MREVKFRAWDGRKYVFSFTKKGKDRLGWFFAAMPGFAKEQFTGLHDKNGKEIYEGDIITATTTTMTFVIEWKDGSAGFNMAWVHDVINSKHHDIEVIGNIHENPELREGLT